MALLGTIILFSIRLETNPQNLYMDKNQLCVKKNVQTVSFRRAVKKFLNILMDLQTPKDNKKRYSRQKLLECTFFEKNEGKPL